MAFGFDSANPLGFVSPTFDDLRADFRAKYLAATGVEIDLEVPSVDLGLLDYSALVVKQAYDDQAGTYASAFVATSSGVALRNLLFPYIGDPQPATFSEQVLPVIGTPLSVIPTGSAVRLASDGLAGLNWTTPAPINLDGGGVGSGTFIYAEAGPKTALALSSWVITTPLANWTSAGASVVDADKGRLAETDAEYRKRYSLSRGGGRILEAVLEVEGVTSAAIFENPTDVPDAFWAATHWVEVLVVGGADADIAAAIQASRGAGRLTVGLVSLATPAPGYPGGSTIVSWSRQVDVPVWIELTIVKGEGYSKDISAEAVLGREQAIREHIVASLVGFPVGLDISAFQVASIAAATPGVPGIKNITPQFVDTVNPPVSAEVVAGERDLLTFDTGRILLNGV